MKRMPRDPLKFDPVELFAAVSRDNNYRIEAEEDIEDFLDKVGKSLKSSLKNQSLLNGKRVEALFAHVAGALGKCAMVKQEDSGAIFAAGMNVQAPDYSIALNDGTRFLVEVKNCHHGDPKKDYEFRKDYVERLENYAKLQGTAVKFAIYFSRIRKWVLLSKDSMTEHRNKYTTNFLEGYAKSEMISLGDRMIGTKPNLSIELIAKPEENSEINKDGQASITIGDVKLYCHNNEILMENEKHIAFYLIRFGDWTTDDPSAEMDGERVRSIRYDFYPDVPWEEEQGFAMLGSLSSMVTSAYNEHTVYESKVYALDARVNPEMFSVHIPNDYKGDQLPLWQFCIQPNMKFKI
ncbi:hypothetical protein [Pseudomonas sp. S2_E02]